MQLRGSARPTVRRTDSAKLLWPDALARRGPASRNSFEALTDYSLQTEPRAMARRGRAPSYRQFGHDGHIKARTEFELVIQHCPRAVSAPKSGASVLDDVPRAFSCRAKLLSATIVRAQASVPRRGNPAKGAARACRRRPPMVTRREAELP